MRTPVAGRNHRSGTELEAMNPARASYFVTLLDGSGGHCPRLPHLRLLP